MDQISVQLTVQTVLGPVFDAESDGELGFEPKPRPDTVMWIDNLQLDAEVVLVRTSNAIPDTHDAMGRR